MSLNRCLVPIWKFISLPLRWALLCAFWVHYCWWFIIRCGLNGEEKLIKTKSIWRRRWWWLILPPDPIRKLQEDQTIIATVRPLTEWLTLRVLGALWRLQRRCHQCWRRLAHRWWQSRKRAYHETILWFARRPQEVVVWTSEKATDCDLLSKGHPLTDDLVYPPRTIYMHSTESPKQVLPTISTQDNIPPICSFFLLNAMPVVVRFICCRKFIVNQYNERLCIVINISSVGRRPSLRLGGVL